VICAFTVAWACSSREPDWSLPQPIVADASAIDSAPMGARTCNFDIVVLLLVLPSYAFRGPDLAA
jgi:hypothetical protein